MAKDSRDRATRNRELRQDSLREQLQANQLIKQTLARVGKLDDPTQDLDANGIARIKAANDASLRLLAKVLPDLKAVELSQNPDNPVVTNERTLDSHLQSLADLIAGAEARAAAAVAGQGKVH